MILGSLAARRDHRPGGLVGAAGGGRWWSAMACGSSGLRWPVVWFVVVCVVSAGKTGNGRGLVVFVVFGILGVPCLVSLVVGGLQSWRDHRGEISAFLAERRSATKPN